MLAMVEGLLLLPAQQVNDFPKIQNYKISFRAPHNRVNQFLRETIKQSDSTLVRYHNFAVLRREFVYTIFYSGFVNATKIRSREECIKAVKYLFDAIGHDASSLDFRTDNITSSGRYKQPIQVGRLKRYFTQLNGGGAEVSFKPQVFAGCTVKYRNGSINLFESGAYTIVGTRTWEAATDIHVKTMAHLQSLAAAAAAAAGRGIVRPFPLG